MSLFFVKAVVDLDRKVFVTYCTLRMSLDRIATNNQRHYDSDTRKQRSQYEMDSIDLFSFMDKNQLTDQKVGLPKLVQHINALALQLPTEFGDNSHKAADIPADYY